MQETGGLSHKQCADILAKVLEDPTLTPEKAKEALHIVAQVSDSGAIMGFINQVLAANPQSIVDFKAGKDRALGFLVGQVMKASHGKVNPAEVSKLLSEELAKR
jgi:aspartyl-tRNA(Asn)/glutamyl-tRNA(Gln) amidotransferase subunit B